MRHGHHHSISGAKMQRDILGPPPLSPLAGPAGVAHRPGDFAPSAPPLPLDLPAHRRKSGHNKCGLGFKYILLLIFASIVAVFMGGLLYRIQGGFLSVPEFAPGNDTSAYDVVFHLFVRRAAWSIGTGILVTVAMLESHKHDPYALRRLCAGFLFAVATFASSMVDSSTYNGVGHESNSYLKPVGIFDGLIGHQCSEWDAWHLTLHELCGMSLRGLVQTAPAGFILFAFGYGLEYLLSGVLMGAIYEVGRLIPFPEGPFVMGVPFAETLWGTWTWAVLIFVLLTNRKSPLSAPKKTIHGRDTSFLRRVVFYPFIALIDAIFLTAVGTYGQVQQEDMLPIYQTYVGMIALTVIFIGAQVIVLLFVPLFTWCCSRAPARGRMYEEMDHTDASATDEENVSALNLHREYAALMGGDADGLIGGNYPYGGGAGRPINENYSSRRSNISLREFDDGSTASCCRRFTSALKAVFVPDGRSPWRWVLMLIRFICIVDALLNLALLLYIVSVNHINPDCEVPWNRS